MPTLRPTSPSDMALTSLDIDRSSRSGAGCNWPAVFERRRWAIAMGDGAGPLVSPGPLVRRFLDAFCGVPIDCPRRCGPGARSYCLSPLAALLQLDLDVDARRQIELHQLVDRLVGRVDDVHQPQVGADLE